jgi:hypothetical protein
MDSDRFDQLARALSVSPPRRSILGLALAGGTGFLLGFADVGAKKKHKHKKKKCKSGTKKCGKKCIGVTNCCSAADCGTSGACSGGACICATGFKSCQGTCIADDACCASDCGPCESCQGSSCVYACQDDQECVSGQCECTPNSCDGCCDGSNCRNGTSHALCGNDGAICDACAGNEECQSGSCVCSCPTGSVCLVNDSCAIDCIASGGVCPSTSPCSGSCSPSVEGGTYCRQPVPADCTSLASCTSTAECPPQTFCRQATCPADGQHKCILLCPP